MYFIILGVFTYSIGYRNIIRLSPFLLFFIVICLILVFVPYVGIEKNGAKRWIGFFSKFSFQPSEFAKYLIPVYGIYCIFIKEGRSLMEELNDKKK